MVGTLRHWKLEAGFGPPHISTSMQADHTGLRQNADPGRRLRRDLRACLLASGQGWAEPEGQAGTSGGPNHGPRSPGQAWGPRAPREPWEDAGNSLHTVGRPQVRFWGRAGVPEAEGGRSPIPSQGHQALSPGGWSPLPSGQSHHPIRNSDGSSPCRARRCAPPRQPGLPWPPLGLHRGHTPLRPPPGLA